MASFVSISEKPTQKSYSQGMLEDPVHRANMEGGTPLTRPRSTAVPKTRELFYQSMSEASKQAMETWERDTVGYGGEAFNWLDPNPNDPRTYGAILTQPIEYNLHPQNPDKWQARLRLGLLSESSSSSSSSSTSSSTSAGA